jgi:ABC-type lipoprotein release transport system permease subunit
MFMLEALVLGLVGVVIGALLGSSCVLYMANHGIFVGDMMSAAGGIAMGNFMKARFSLSEVLSLSGSAFLVILFASAYPAWFAARREPAASLRAI